MNRQNRLVVACAACLVANAFNAHASDDKLKIVFMLGQSEMVGLADVGTAAYMLEKPLVPPRDVTINAHKAMLHQINGAYLYWQAMYSYDGPEAKKKELKALLEERTRFKAEFKQHVVDTLEKNDGMFRDKKYSKRRGAYRGFWLYNMCDDECETTGITPKIRAILDGPDNKFNVEAAYEQLLKDSNARYQKQLELNKVFLPGAKSESFAALAEAVKAGVETREAYAELAKKHLNMPTAERTYITAVGTVAGEPQDDVSNVARGKLSVGYGGNVRSIGLEYAAGMALERTMDGPILVVKCAWDKAQNLVDLWHSPSMGAPETAEADSVTPTWAWDSTIAHVKKVLMDPGKYHPAYDAKAGYEIAGLIWFQGLGQPDTPDYASNLASLFSDLRAAVKSPKMPIVCATVGTMFFKGESDDHPVNLAINEVAALSEFKGTVDVVETYNLAPSEFGVINSLFHKRKLIAGSPEGKVFSDTIGRSSTRLGRRTAPYWGAASFYLLAGNEAGTKLAGMAGRFPK